MLGVDLGSRRIGLALSDPSGTLASPLSVLERSGDRVRDHRAIVEAARENEAHTIVVGLPRSMSGAKGRRHATRAPRRPSSRLWRATISRWRCTTSG